MKRKIIDYILLSSILISAIIIWVVIQFGVPSVPGVKETITKGVADQDITTICIEDIQKINRIEYVNYTPNEFLNTSSHTGKRIKLDKNTKFAPKGTLEFVFLNLDPNDSQFKEKSDALQPYLRGDGRWHFMLYLPPCFSAVTVYNKATYVTNVGEIEDYDYIQYSDYRGKTENHKSETEPTLIDIGFYSRRHSLSEDMYIRSLTITIHYECEEGKFSGFYGFPLVGDDSVIRDTISTDKTLLTSIFIIAILVTSILAFTCGLKKNLSSLPQMLAALGISGYALSKSLLYSFNTTPYFCLILVPIFASMVFLSAILSLRIKIKNKPVWLIFLILTVINAIFMVISSVLPNDALRYSLQTITEILSVILAVDVLASCIYLAMKQQYVGNLLAPLATVFFMISFVFTSSYSLEIHSVNIWLLIFVLGIIIFSALQFFFKLELSNRYLTNNLQIEVSKQTTELKNLVNEREQLLRYLSHDMQLPIKSIKKFLQDLKNSEQNEDKIKKYNVINQKIEFIEGAFNDLQKFSKSSFISEGCSSVNVSEIIAQIYEDLSPDCEANGILLHCEKHKTINAYAKKDTLLFVINNLVFNAIEHGECSNIYMTIHKSKVKGICQISIIDDGKGIDSEDVFLPYYSTSKNEDNLGLGLYICRQHISSMGGRLTYSRKDNKTIFEITLNLC